MTGLVDAARERIECAVLETGNVRDLGELVRHMHGFVDALKDKPAFDSSINLTQS